MQNDKSTHADTLKNKQRTTKEIVIQYMDPGMETFIDISCNAFITSYTDEKRKIIVKENSQDYIEIDSLFNLFKDNSAITSIDVRAEIINRNSKDSIVCMAGFGQFFSKSSGKFMINKPLHAKLIKMINQAMRDNKIAHPEN